MRQGFCSFFLAGLLSVLTFLPSRSQTINSYAHASLAEKIYLQLDGKVYTTNQTIWFKSIVTNAINHAPSKLSGVLYVELIGADERIMEKKLIKLTQGIGDGFFELNKSYAEGPYQVRAYTEWNKNFGSDFVFREYIRLFATSANEKVDPVGKITLVQDQTNRRLNATLDPFLLDSLHKRELTVIVTLDAKKDTLMLKKTGADKYLVDYVIPPGSQFITLQMLTRNQLSYAKTIALDEDYFDLQFFPESGELVHGLPAKVGFKAVDYNGQGKLVEGEIVNKEGNVVVSFKSNQLGMGCFVLYEVDSTVNYFARLSSKTEERLSLLYPLPPVSPSGNTMFVSKTGEEIRIRAASSYLEKDSISLRISCRGVVYYEVRGKMKGGLLHFKLLANTLPEGILALTMLDNSMKPVAERLYFNERAESRLRLSVCPDKNSYAQREMTRLDIQTTKGGDEPVNASLSLLVVNKGQLGQLQGMRQNILASFLLSSDLKGEIENPGYYFGNTSSRLNDLDALMLTQGWRKYLYAKQIDSILYQPEPYLTVSGTVSSILSRKKKRVAEITMLTFGKNRSILTQKTDSSGRFKFNMEDEFGQNLNVLIQSTGKSGQNKDFNITLDKKILPTITFNHVNSIAKADSLVNRVLEESAVRKKVDDTFKLSAGDILLGEVEVEAYRMTPERKIVIDRFGKPDAIISGKAIQEKEQKWSYGLYSVLMFNFPDKVFVRRARDGNLYAKVSPFGITLVVIDGIPVRPYEYPFIPNIPPGEVKSFEIIEGARNFTSLYLELFPMSTDPPAWGDVIAIYTHAGNGIYGAKSAKGIMQAAVPVFSAPREFYAPKYENIRPEEWYKPDLRALVHWEPKLRTDSIGKVSASFYNADHLGEMMVVVEAISDKGELGYQEFVYQVEKNEKNKEGR